MVRSASPRSAEALLALTYLMPHIPASAALSRFRVIDMTQVRAGPTAARQLADWGADVIQVQMPEHMRGDDTLGGQDGSDYQYTHRNKRSITLNLKEPEGIEVLKKLVATADVLLENFRPDVKTRLGIDYETLSKVNPRLVYASISGFGQTGPYATRPGFDQIAQGMGGLMSVTGLPGHGPLRVGIPIADLCGGIFAAYGVTVALLEREASGKGQWVHTSLLRGDDLHDGLPDLALDASTARSPGRRATSTRPASRPASTGPRTATSTSRSSAARSGSASPRRWARPSGSPTSARRPRAARSVHRDWLNAEIEKRLAAQHERPLDREAQRRGRRVRAHQQHARKSFEEPQVKHLGHPQEGGLAAAGRADAHGPARHAHAHALHHRARGAAARRALRGDPRRDRLRPRDPRAHESRRSLLMNDMSLSVPPPSA